MLQYQGFIRLRKQAKFQTICALICAHKFLSALIYLFIYVLIIIMFNYLYYYKTLYVLSHNATTPYDWNLLYGYCSTVCGLADLLLVKLILLLLLNHSGRIPAMSSINGVNFVLGWIVPLKAPLELKIVYPLGVTLYTG